MASVDLVLDLEKMDVNNAIANAPPHVAALPLWDFPDLQPMNLQHLSRTSLTPRSSSLSATVMKLTSTSSINHITQFQYETYHERERPLPVRAAEGKKC